MLKKRLKDLEIKCKEQQQTKWLFNPLLIFNYDSKDLNNSKTKYTINYFKKNIEINTNDLEGFYKDNNLIPKINCNPIEIKVCENRTEADFYSKINAKKTQKMEVKNG